MEKDTLELIINNKNAIHDLDRYMIDSGKLHLICDKIAKTNDNETREQLIKKMKSINKNFSESIVKLAGMITTLKYNAQSPLLQ